VERISGLRYRPAATIHRTQEDSGQQQEGAEDEQRNDLEAERDPRSGQRPQPYVSGWNGTRGS